MFTLFILFALLLIAAAAPLWATDSRNEIDSAEWERRRTWRGRW